MLIFDGFGHFRFRPKMILRFSFSVSFSVETQHENTEIHKAYIQAAIVDQFTRLFTDIMC